ncbi:permease [Carboxylicivirga caseinilyticus]|uniref:permease n=1 Tax=Carboxylicivirga caseinilyticus TaxID=3417572 RepID=UPI003D347DF1|nr:permease [Marinilabiliaceae bacterium A049]
MIPAISNRWVIDKEWVAKVVVFSTLTLMLADTIYMNISGIGYGHKEECALYQFLPRWGFYIYEHFVELFMVVLLGIFGGVLIEQHTKKLKRFFPKNQLLAFVYASFLPVCSCGVIPVVESMKERVKLRTLVTFIIATPLLNPYIVFMSVTVLGVKYALIRVIASFMVAVFSGLMVEKLANYFQLQISGVYDNCGASCGVGNMSPFRKTMVYMKKILPYMLIAGLLTLLFEYFQPQRFLESFSFSTEPFSTGIMMLVGIPIYVCNGADVLFLKPLLEFTDLSLASAMAFSLASSAVCISSVVMLLKFFGKKLAIALIGAVIFSIILVTAGVYLIDDLLVLI